MAHASSHRLSWCDHSSSLPMRNENIALHVGVEPRHLSLDSRCFGGREFTSDCNLVYLVRSLTHASSSSESFRFSDILVTVDPPEKSAHGSALAAAASIKAAKSQSWPKAVRDPLLELTLGCVVLRPMDYTRGNQTTPWDVAFGRTTYPEELYATAPAHLFAWLGDWGSNARYLLHLDVNVHLVSLGRRRAPSHVTARVACDRRPGAVAGGRGDGPLSDGARPSL